MKCANCGKELTEETRYSFVGDDSYCSEDCAYDALSSSEWLKKEIYEYEQELRAESEWKF